jgi:hypothetical protein
VWLLGGCATAEVSGSDGLDGPDAGSSTLRDAAPAADAPVVPDAAAAPDAPSMTPDAAPVPDAAPPPPDAPPPPPDACVPILVQLLSNPSFDLGPGGGWSETSSAGVNLLLHQSQTPIDADTPDHLVWLGGYLEDPGAGISGIDILRQDITLPADATGFHLTGFRFIGSQEPTDGADHFDTLAVSIRDPATNNLLETLTDTSVGACSSFYGPPCTWSNMHATSSYQSFTLTPAGNYAGQSIRIEFLSNGDIVFNTNFFLDTLQARVTACP